MNYTSFERALLEVLYQERVFDKINEMIPFTELVSAYELKFQPGWLLSAQRSLQSAGLIDGPARSSNDQMAHGKITGLGMKKIEELYLRADGRVPILIPKIGVDYDMFPSSLEDNNIATDSSRWTGLPRDFVLDEHRRRAIVSALDAAEDELTVSTVSQHDRAQARAYVIAAKTLLEAPDPSSDLAWELITRASNLAGIASLFVAVLALFAVK